MDKIEEVKTMISSIQSLGYGLLSMLFVSAVIAACTVGKSALKKHLRKANQKAPSHEKR
jgi:membrane protein required for beta-lactamase induction